MIDVAITFFSFGFFAGWYFFRDANCCLYKRDEQ